MNKTQDNDNQTFKEIVSTFESMSAKKAAPIITGMEEHEAITILSNLKPDILASILENMSDEHAARYTTILTNNSQMENDEAERSFHKGGDNDASWSLKFCAEKTGDK